MQRIWQSFLSVAMLVAPACANAASIPEPEWDASDAEVSATETARPPISIAEFWRIMQSEMSEKLKEIGVLLEIEMSEALAPTGDPEQGWASKGFDLIGHLQSLPGGIGNNALLSGGELPTLQFFGKIPAGLLDDWEIVQTGSKAVSPAAAKAGTFVVMGPYHIAFMADEQIQKANAHCLKEPIEKATDYLIVYRYSGSSFDLDDDASIDAESEAIVISSMISNFGLPVFCTIYRRQQDGSFVTLSYTPEGRPLGNMDDESDRSKIVSTFDLFEQLNGHYVSLFADEESPPSENDAAVDEQ